MKPNIFLNFRRRRLRAEIIVVVFRCFLFMYLFIYLFYYLFIYFIYIKSVHNTCVVKSKAKMH